jgi:hypothetical protein
MNDDTGQRSHLRPLLAAACGNSSGSPPSTPYAKALAYSQCMRANGVPRFPDPSTSGGGVGFDLSQSILSSPQFSSAKQACQSQAPGRAG